MADSNPSPLKHFVLAKKKITAIFEQLLDYVTEGTDFVNAEYIKRPKSQHKQDYPEGNC